MLRPGVVLVGAICVTSVASLGLRAQAPAQPQPSFRSSVNYIEVAVRVRDSHGQFVRGLTQNDFQISEEGRPQTIANFLAVDIPITRRQATQTAVVSPTPTTLIPVDLSESVKVEGRVYLFLLDDFFLEPNYALKVRNLVREFVLERMGPSDLASVALASGAVLQDLTSDPGELLSVVDRFVST